MHTPRMTEEQAMKKGVTLMSNSLFSKQALRNAEFSTDEHPVFLPFQPHHIAAQQTWTRHPSGPNSTTQIMRMAQTPGNHCPTAGHGAKAGPPQHWGHAFRVVLTVPLRILAIYGTGTHAGYPPKMGGDGGTR